MQILVATSTAELVGELAGGKARGLHTLTSNGFRVPNWAVLGVDVFGAFMTANGLNADLENLCTATDVDEAQKLATALRQRITDAELPEAIRALIDRAYTEVGGGAVAVRSSGAAEDGAALSHAGQFDSYLNVNDFAAVQRGVQRCWASAYSNRSVGYLFTHGAPISNVGIAVIVQQLVPAKASGVVFTADPISGARDVVAVSSVYGLGEGLVSGAVDADYVRVDRATGAILDRVVGDKTEQYLPATDDGCTVTPVPEQLRNEPSLSDVEIAELVQLGIAIESFDTRPLDIEWVSDGAAVWVVQARPITTLHDVVSPESGVVRGAAETVTDDAMRIWDNSNIIESFSGISSPLTFTTASDVYGRVYRSYARSLRVSRNELRQLDEWTPAMLGYFHGRVYYNLLHWYRMVGIAPGYPLNRRVLEVALGVDENLDNDIAKTLRPFVFDSVFRRIVARTVTTATYLKRFAEIDRKTDRFMTEFYRVYDEYEAIDYSTLSGDEVYARYRRCERDLVDRWGPMMVLDAILLTSSGMLFALTKLFLRDTPEWFTYAVVSPGSDVESAEPARVMAELARFVRKDPTLTEFINTTPPDQAHEALQEAKSSSQVWQDFAEQVDDYIARFGYRSLDELKLETPDLREDPASLFVMLRSAMPDAPLSRRNDADTYLDERLGGVRRRIYEALRGKTSRALANRERLRFCRTRAFGMVKRMIRAMGRDLTARGVLDEFSDVFYLRLDELHGCYEGTTDVTELAGLVAARKAQRLVDAELVAPSRFTTYGPALTDAELTAQGWIPVHDKESAKTGSVLRGTPSAAGVVRGTAVVVTEPRDVAGGILIAYRTDPGWVAALPSASALVIERGSPLTHVAIVARELGIPTVVQVKDVTTLVRTGMTIEIDGAGGTVRIITGEAE